MDFRNRCLTFVAGCGKPAFDPEHANVVTTEQLRHSPISSTQVDCGCIHGAGSMLK